MLFKSLFLVVPFIVYGAGWLSLNLYRKFEYCFGEIVTLPDGYIACYSNYIDYGWALVHMGEFLIPVGILLFFSSKEVVGIWFKRLAAWFIPLWIILVILVEEYTHQFWPFIQSSSELSAWLGALFLIISALIIFFSNRKK